MKQVNLCLMSHKSHQYHYEMIICSIMLELYYYFIRSEFIFEMYKKNNFSNI